MDNLCHTLVGAALAETGLRRRSRYATAALIVGANLPDLDVPAAFTPVSLSFRRGITHGIPALLLLPFLLTGALLLWHRLRGGPERLAPRALLLLSALAIATHPLLDWMNSYGMRWLVPLDGRWTYGDSLFIVDPWLLLVLGAGWLVARRRRRQGAAAAVSERMARSMVGLAAAYVLLMVGLTTAGRRVAEHALGATALSHRQLMVAPPFFASWRRDVILDNGAGYRFGRIRWLPRPALVLEGGEVPKQLDVLLGVPATTRLESFLAWARFPFVERLPGGVLLADDLRYARGGRSFAAVEVRPGGEATRQPPPVSAALPAR